MEQYAVYFALVCAAAAVAYGIISANWILALPQGNDRMKQIAAATNAEYFAAATSDQLKKVYQNIGSDIGYEKADREVTARFAGYGLALAVLAALGAISLGAKWP